MSPTGAKRPNRDAMSFTFTRPPMSPTGTKRPTRDAMSSTFKRPNK